MGFLFGEIMVKNREPSEKVVFDLGTLTTVVKEKRAPKNDRITPPVPNSTLFLRYTGYTKGIR